MIKIENKNLSTKIRQYMAIRLCLGYRMSTPIIVMLAEAAEPTLLQRANYLAYKFSLKLISLNEHNILNKFFDLIYTAKEENCLNHVLQQLPLLNSFYNIFNKYSTKIQRFTKALPYPYSIDSMVESFKDNIDTYSGNQIKKSRNTKY